MRLPLLLALLLTASAPAFGSDLAAAKKAMMRGDYSQFATIQSNVAIDPDARFHYGLAAFYGYGPLTADRVLGLAHIEQAAREGHAKAAHKAGMILLSDEAPYGIDRERGRLWLAHAYVVHAYQPSRSALIGLPKDIRLSLVERKGAMPQGAAGPVRQTTSVAARAVQPKRPAPAAPVVPSPPKASTTAATRQRLPRATCAGVYALIRADLDAKKPIQGSFERAVGWAVERDISGMDCTSVPEDYGRRYARGERAPGTVAQQSAPAPRQQQPAYDLGEAIRDKSREFQQYQQDKLDCYNRYGRFDC